MARKRTLARSPNAPRGTLPKGKVTRCHDNSCAGTTATTSSASAGNKSSVTVSWRLADTPSTLQT